MLEKELKIAIEAALEAGELLRREFHLPAGPRGHGAHAEADEEAEWLIRKRLMASFPAYGYRGEETGSIPTNGTFIWLIDPNDGTATYLRGARGSAVSIGLLRDRIPVLGVVYAYAAPDDDGDLICWAEGCVFTRNNTPVRAVWDISSKKHAIILGSTHREDIMSAVLECAAPYRYRAFPSIAYRLALAAAGDGAAAASWHQPGDWDYAAGHALLRAAGGIFLNEKGEEIKYAADGSSKVVCCFGGHPEVVREIYGREWKSISQKKVANPCPFSFARLKAGGAIVESRLLSRAQGCMLGHVAGDALGQQVEFMSAATIHNQYPDGLRSMADGGSWDLVAGQPTDDSELMLMLARSIVQERSFDIEKIAQAYHYWFSHSDPFDAGNTTSQAMRAVTDEDANSNRAAKVMSDNASQESQANGSLMRISALGIYGHARSMEELWEMACADSVLTHPHPVCREACALYTIAIALAIHHGFKPEQIYQNVLDLAVLKTVNPSLLEVLKKSSGSCPVYDQSAGWVLIAFQNAFFQLLNAKSFEEGVVDTVMQGGDTDTNAAIAGALLGAVYGRNAVPVQWRDMVLSCRPDPKVEARHPRPMCFWPVDLLTLAELLLLVGQVY